MKIVFKVYLNFFVTKNIQTKTTKWTAFIWRNGDVSPPPGSNMSHRGLGCRIHHVFNISTMLWNYISRFVARYFWEPVRKSSEKAITSGLLFPKHQEKTITPIKRQTKMDWGEGRCAKDQTASICLVSCLLTVLCRRVSQPGHYTDIFRRSEEDGLCIIVWCSGAFLISTHWMTVAY